VTKNAALTILLGATLTAQLARSQQSSQATQAPESDPANQTRSPPAATASQQQTPAAAGRKEPPEVTTVVNSIIARENQLLKNLRNYSPRVETYIQDFRVDPELGTVPNNDHYSLGLIDFGKSIEVRSFLPQPGLSRRMTGGINHVYSLHYPPRAFASTIVMDTARFDRQHYEFEFVDREFLGTVRCLVFDVKPRRHAGVGLFEGRIWAEDEAYNVVRFNGIYTPAPKFTTYFHFDSWRENLQPGLWLPVYVYSEESDFKFSLKGALHFKAQTRLWGYDLVNPRHQSELTSVLVEAPTKVRDTSQTSTDPSPVASERQWEKQAENNVLERLEKAGLLAPRGDVDKVTETVVTNLIVTNHLGNLPDVHCRTLLTSTLESLTIGNTVILSRGLIDVLPDEPSLAAILAHELAHIVLGQATNAGSAKYAFNDRLMMSDQDILRRLSVNFNEEEEAAADTKAIELLKNSPYKDQLGQAGLFLRAMADTAPHTPQLFGAHLGGRLVQGNQVRRMAELMAVAPELQRTRVEQISALPLGSRVKVNAWNDQIELVKSEPVALLSARERRPFEVTPLLPYLVRFGSTAQSGP
jgi:hypothetical protein